MLFVLHAPVWLTCLIAIVPILLILGVVLYLYAEPDNPANSTEHHSEDGREPDEEPPDTGSGEGRDDVLLAA